VRRYFTAAKRHAQSCKLSRRVSSSFSLSNPRDNPSNDRFSGRKSYRQPAEVAQTTGFNCLFFMMSVAAPAHARKSPFGATVIPPDRSSAAAKSAAKLVALGSLPRLAFVTNDEPLFGLGCQESARDLVPFFSGFVDFLF
jgi:hypothetical protein